MTRNDTYFAALDRVTLALNESIGTDDGATVGEGGCEAGCEARVRG